MEYVGGVVELASVGDGGEEGGVGLNQDAVGRGGGGDLLDVGGPGVGEVAGEGEVAAEGEGPAGILLGTGEAVEQEGQAGRGPVGLEQGEEVVGGVGGAEAGLGLRSCQLTGAAVQDDGLAGGGGDGHLGAEGGLLDVDVRVVEVVVVEADLADGDAERILRQQSQTSKGFGRCLMGFLGVNARACPEAEIRSGMLAGDPDRAVHGCGAVADADAEDTGEAGSPRGGEDRVEIVVEIEVCV